MKNREIAFDTRPSLKIMEADEESSSSRRDRVCDSCYARLTEATDRCALCDRLDCKDDDCGEERCTRNESTGHRTTRTRSGDHGRPRIGECASSVVRWDGSPLRRSRTWRRNSGGIWWWILALLLLALSAARADSEFDAALRSTTLAPSLPSSNGTTINSQRVCQSMDFRNDPKELERLRGCRVIEGFVHIVLMPDSVDEEVWENLRFPELVEITDHLLMFRVPKLRSIGQLFPNLSVIRGNTLFTNYALISFENTDLQEVGLYSLTRITRGGVRISNNPKLCYADTIDWDLITEQDVRPEVLTNKMKNECPVCESDCPQKASHPGMRLCWNSKTCQKVCNCPNGGACMDSGKCCHPSCLGDCTGETASDCKVCRDFVVNNTQCASSCPSDSYEFMNRRCITKGFCRKMSKPKELGNLHQYPYKPFGNKCLLECPHGYMEVNNTGVLSCKKCEGHCEKECAGGMVTNVASAQKMRGCTVIKGNMEINVRSGQNVVRELHESLQDITVITGYLKVFRSTPLVSLNFFKNLTLIKGEELENKDYSLVVIDNLNLQELWNWTNRERNLTIKSHKGEAKILFHYNPKLCTEEIELLRQKTRLAPYSDNDVSKLTNGDKVACNLTELNTYAKLVGSRSAWIYWKKFEHHDPRKIIGYVVYYKEAPFQNVTMYESREAGSSDDWMTVDVPLSNDEDEPKNPKYYQYDLNANDGSKKSDEFKENVILNNLKPFTQYVYYIKTYAISMENMGAISTLVYFTTKAGKPSPPRYLNIYPNATDTLIINWMEPAEPNGIILYYKVIGKFERYDEDVLEERDYCDQPMAPTIQRSINEMVAEKKQQAEKEMLLAKKREEEKEIDACMARKKHVESVDESLINSGIAFEDALHNQIYVKRNNNNNNNNNRRKRDYDLYDATPYHTYDRLKRYVDENGIVNLTASVSLKHANETTNLTDLDPMSHPNDEVENGVFKSFERLVPPTNLTLVMKKLHHFGKYTIQVMACRDPHVDTNEPPCSNDAMKSEQTFRKEGADDIPSHSFRVVEKSTVNETTTFKLFWDAPEDPNGIILTYQIEYKKTDVPKYKAQLICISALEFQHNKQYVTVDSLPSGNISLRVRASTFAGDGAYTEAIYVDVPEKNVGLTFGKIVLYTLILLTLVTGTFGLYMWKKKKESEAQNMRLIATVNPEYISTNVYKPDQWELPRKKITLLKELGNGSFGMVYEGIARDVIKGQPEIRCAVKTVTENATMKERDDFLNEASVMKAFNTHHVVRLLGVVSIGQPTLVIMELMTNGDLKTYLRSHRPDTCEDKVQNPPTLKRILQMAIEIADGMAYLAAKKFVHRDLAARNCMVADDLTVKIGDFGMTRDIYETDYYRKGTRGLLPVRWMAPESLRDGLFASSSDVWSYGVVLWEMVTLASQPYQGLSNDQALRYIIDGGVMERPENCPDSLYVLMRQTWNHVENKRPTFIDIIELLMQEINLESFEKVSFYHSPEGIEARNQNIQFHPNDKNLELEMLQDLHEEEELEGQEDSPLRQDFGDDFSSFEPTIGINKNGTTAHFNKENFRNSPRTTLGFEDLDSSKTPLKASFDDFDGVSAASLASSKDTLNLPIAEDSVRSVKNSPFAQKKTNSKGNISHGSVGRLSLSPQSPSVMATSRNSGSRGSPSALSTGRPDPEYENRSPISISSQPHDVVSFRVSFPSLDAGDSDSTVIIMGKDSNSPSPRTPIHTDSNNTSPSINTTGSNKKQYSSKSPGDSQPPPTLNNGYIGGAAAT